MVSRVYFCGHDVSLLGFGAMRLPMRAGRVDQNQVNQMVREAMARGVNYFDTSFIYIGGRSETALGIALEGVDRSSYFLADKMSFFSADGWDYMERQFEAQLRRLKTDFIDFYLLHSMSENTWDTVRRLDAIRWAEKKKAEGKIGHLGFSIHGDAALLREILDAGAWDFAQIQYNYMDLEDKPGWEGLEELRRRGIPAVIMEPLKGGVLADIPAKLCAPFRALDQSSVRFAFRWLAHQPGIATILSGMSSLEQLRENLSIFEDMKPLNELEESAINQVRENIRAAQKVNCTGCRYCMPCPKGIDIPGTFKAWNTRAMNQSANWISGADVDRNAVSACAACGACVKKCPQAIDIPAKLQQAVTR